MAYIELRTLLRLTGGTDWVEASVGPLTVRPARAVLAAALASPPPPAGHRGDVSTPLFEAAQLQSYLTLDEPGILRWKEKVHQAPPHLRRYLTQAAAIGLTVELAEIYGWDPFNQNHRLFWYDDLKTVAPELSMMMPGGNFPDILFDTPDGWMSLESRGRSGQPPTSAPNSAQIERLDQLDTWASAVSRSIGYEPGWGMGWAWFSNDDARVDLFDPGEPVQLDSDSLIALDNFAREVEARFANSIRNGRSAFRLGVDGEAVVSIVESEDSDVANLVGVAVSTQRREMKRERVRQDFDLVPYGDLIFFASTVPAGRDGGSVERFVREAFAEELE